MLEKENLFLSKTKFCNFDHYLIKAISNNLKRKSKNNRDYAIHSFYWVRDNIKYRLGSWNETASETIYRKEGTSTNKANVFVALLRANGISSGYGIMKVNGKSYLGPALTPMLAKHVGSESTHIYAAVYLGKWIKVDPSDDMDLCESISHFNHTAEIVDWNGYDDAELALEPGHILSDEFPIENIDSVFSKKTKNASGINQKMLNICLEFYRKNGKSICIDDNLEKKLLKHLMKNHPVLFFYYLTFSKISDFRKSISGLKKKTFN